MLTDPLPDTLDVRKAATRGAIARGTLEPLELPRFRDLLAAGEGIIDAVLTFSRDEEGRYLVRAITDSTVTVTCPAVPAADAGAVAYRQHPGGGLDGRTGQAVTCLAGNRPL